MTSIPQESEVQALRQELADTRKKLQDYGDTIVSLHSELRTLRNSICDTCKRKFALANVESSQDVAGSSSVVNHPHSQISPERKKPPPKRHHALDYPPKRSGFPKSKILNYFMRNSSQTRPSKRSPPSDPPQPRIAAVYDKPAPILNQHLSSSNTILQKIEPGVSRWSAKRDAAGATLEVTFVRVFVNKDSVSSVRFSPDGKSLAAALGKLTWLVNGEIVIYDVVTGEQTCVLAANRSQYSMKGITSIMCLSFSPDGRYLVVGDNRNRVTVWDIRNKRIRNIFRGHSRSIDCVNFSPNGRFVLSLSWDDGTMRLWNLRDGSAKILPDAGYIWSATFSPNGQYIAAGNGDGMLMIWDVRTVRLVQRWIGEGRISRVVFTPDGRGLLSGHKDGTVKNWNIGSLGMVTSNGRAVPITLEYKGLKSWIYDIAISADGRWVLCTSVDRTTVIWDARSAIRQWTLIGHDDVVTSLDFSPSGKYLALGSHDRRVSLWKCVSP